MVNKLFDEGNEIIIFTARGSTTNIDWTKQTEKQLSEWNVKYHKLLLGKPYADIYIDDKGHNSDSGLIMSNAIRLKYIKPKLKLDKNLIIVGSSSKLLNFDGKNYQFKSVVRFNRAPTIGYEDFVGNKTSLGL